MTTRRSLSRSLVFSGWNTLVPALLAGFTVLVLSLLVATGASAATVTVTTTADAAASPPTGSLRWAIQQANASSTTGGPCQLPCVINFAASAEGTHALVGPMDAINVNGVTIDGYSAPNAVPNSSAFGSPLNAAPKVVVRGPGGSSGLSSVGTGTVIKGLVLQNFTNAISLGAYASDAVIAGNFIGTDVTGGASAANSTGIALSSFMGGTVTIGGSSPADFNVISGNSGDGIFVSNSAATVFVQGNYIGVNAAGNAALGNGVYGIRLQSGATGNKIGDSALGNVISGNGEFGIAILGNSGAVVDSNRIGTNAAGTGAIPNGSGGILNDAFSDDTLIGYGGSGNLILGGGSGIGIDIIDSNYVRAWQNTIRSHAIGVGVTFAEIAIGNEIRDNAISANGIGIDLGKDGVTANDATDIDFGPNNFQNFPTIDSAVAIDGLPGEVRVSIDSTSGNPSLVIEVFKADGSANAQGLQSLATLCTGNSLSNQLISIPAGLLAPGDRVVATATGYFDVCDVLGSSDGTSEFSPAVTAVAGVGISDLSVTKTDGVASVAAGSPVTYTIVVSNAGPSATTGATLTDTLPVALSGATWTCTASAGAVCGAPSGVGNINTTLDLAAGASATYTVTATLSPTATGTLVNTATVAPGSDATDLAPTNNTGTDISTITQQNDLAITKTDGVTSVTAGSTVVYTIVVTNNGPSSVTGATVADTLPGTLSGATWSCVASGGSCTASGSGNINDTVSLSPAGTATYTLTATLAASATGTLSNTATVTAPVAAAATDPNLANNSATDSDAIAASADLAITKTDGVASVNAGTAVSYTIVVTNNGPSDISGASITDTFPVSITGVTWTCSASVGSACGAAAGSGNLATSANLLVGGTATYIATGTLSAAATGTLTNTATVAVPAGSTDPLATNNSATDTDSIVPQADVSITKSAFSPVIAGTTVTYTITVSNAGPAAANGVSVVENLILAAGLSGPRVEKRGVRPLLAGATWTCSATAGSSCAAASGTGDINTTVNLLAGGVATFNVAAPLATTASGTLSSTTTVTVPPSVYDPTPGNNVSSVSAAIIQQASLSITKTNNTTAVEPLLTSTYTITVSNAGPSNAPGVLVSDVLPAGLTGATWTCVASAGSTCPAGGSGNINASVDLLAGGSATFNLTATVSASSGSVSNTATLAPPTGVSDPSSADNSATDTDTVIECPAEPQPLSTTPNASHTQVTFVWSDVGAPIYELWYSIDGGAFNSAGTATTTQLVVNISPATETIAWYVVAVQGSCVINGPTSTVTIVEPQTCDAPDTPLAAVIGSVNSGQQYTFFWFTEDFGVRFEYAESNGPDLTGAIWVPTTSHTATFVHDNTSSVSVQYCYAVRAFRNCPDGAKQSDISEPVCVSVLPADTPHGDMVLEEGDTDLVSQFFRLCSDENERVYDCSNSDFDQKSAAVIAPHSGPTVSLGSDRTWMSVNPPTTTVPPTGTNVTVTVNPGSLPTGTNTGSVVATSTTTGQTSNVPFSVNVVTPVSPQGKTVPPANALLIPAVAHVEGINSRWQSDIRMSNTSLQKVAYDLTFTPSGQNGSAVGKKTRLELNSGETKALDDIVKHWYGLGTLQNGSNGVLEIRPVNFNGKTEDASLGYATVASSRTYNDTTKGTYGQWIPAVPFASFIGRGPSGVSPILSMQQIAQSSRYRTNLGVVEGAGQPVTVQFTVFNSAGTKLTDFTVALKAMEHQQLNGILASKNITVADGRIEAKVVQGDGRITTYASVVDAGTNDPLLVPGVVATDKRGTRFVLPGIADLDTGRNHWRSDTRIFNPGTTPVAATAIFYEQNDPSKTKSAPITIGAGQVLVLDDTLRTLFGSENVGGAIHIVTPSETALVATSRTYDQQSTGTFGQFIEAFTAADAVGVADRSLQILQIEQSDRYRTNLGLAEVTGSEATVEITALIPESTVAPKLRLVLKPNEFTQLNGVLKQMGVGTAYNVRLSVKVVEGGGRVSAYGSVIDQSTQDPTYVPAQ